MKPTDVFVDHWTAKSLEAGGDYPAHLHFVRRLIATVTEEHCKAIEIAAEKRSSYDLAAQNMALESIDAIRSWSGEEDKKCTNS